AGAPPARARPGGRWRARARAGTAARRRRQPRRRTPPPAPIPTPQLDPGGGRARRIPRRQAPLLDPIPPHRDERAEDEEESAGPDEVDERLDEHGQIDRFGTFVQRGGREDVTERARVVVDRRLVREVLAGVRASAGVEGEPLAMADDAEE